MSNSPVVAGILLTVLATSVGAAGTASAPGSALDALRGDSAPGAVAPPAPMVLSEETLQRLFEARAGDAFQVPELARVLGLADKPGLELRRVQPYAAGARVREIHAGGVRAISRTPRRFFLGRAGETGMAFIVDPRERTLTGFLNRQGASFGLSGSLDQTLEWTAVAQAKSAAAAGDNQCLTRTDDQPHDPLAVLRDGIPFSQRAAVPLGTPLFETEVAVDTDNEWMAGLSNNTSTATTFIEDIFMFMNVFYERDVALRLLIGDTFLRTAPDPYTESDPNEFLDEFGEEWRVNQTAVERDFAMLFSGRSISGGSFSGVAWLNLYCNDGFQFTDSNMNLRTAGSYSVNRIGSSRTAANTAQFVGHELGHNLGSPHTHCFSTMPLDQCYNRESGANCYTGAEMCPSGPGTPGTIMSYCHLSSAGCGLNDEEFHPEVINLFDTNIASNSPACIAPAGPDNTAPVSEDDAYAALTNTTLSVSAPGVLDNDTDVDMDDLTAELVSGPGNAQSFTLNMDGSFSYTPATDFEGLDSFTYQANDGTENSQTATVVIAVGLFRDGFEDAP